MVESGQGIQGQSRMVKEGQGWSRMVESGQGIQRCQGWSWMAKESQGIQGESKMVKDGQGWSRVIAQLGDIAQATTVLTVEGTVPLCPALAAPSQNP